LLTFNKNTRIKIIYDCDYIGFRALKKLLLIEPKR